MGHIIRIKNSNKILGFSEQEIELTYSKNELPTNYPKTDKILWHPNAIICKCWDGKTNVYTSASFLGFKCFPYPI